MLTSKFPFWKRKSRWEVARDNVSEQLDHWKEQAGGAIIGAGETLLHATEALSHVAKPLGATALEGAHHIAGAVAGSVSSGAHTVASTAPVVASGVAQTASRTASSLASGVAAGSRTASTVAAGVSSGVAAGVSGASHVAHVATGKVAHAFGRGESKDLAIEESAEAAKVVVAQDAVEDVRGLKKQADKKRAAVEAEAARAQDELEAQARKKSKLLAKYSAQAQSETLASGAQVIEKATIQAEAVRDEAEAVRLEAEKSTRGWSAEARQARAEAKKAQKAEEAAAAALEDARRASDEAERQAEARAKEADKQAHKLDKQAAKAAKKAGKAQKKAQSTAEEVRQAIAASAIATPVTAIEVRTEAAEAVAPRKGKVTEAEEIELAMGKRSRASKTPEAIVELPEPIKLSKKQKRERFEAGAIEIIPIEEQKGSKLPLLLVGLAVGAAAIYFFGPSSGRRNRAEALDGFDEFKGKAAAAADAAKDAVKDKAAEVSETAAVEAAAATTVVDTVSPPLIEAEPIDVAPISTPTAPGEALEPGGQAEVGMSATDLRTSTDLGHMEAAQDLSFDFNTADGIVTVRGVVPTEADRAQIESILKARADIKEVRMETTFPTA